MDSAGERTCGLDAHGIHNVGQEYWNLRTSALIEQAVIRREGILAHCGPFVVRTGRHTGRAPNDKFIVDEPSSAEHIWWGTQNRPFSTEHFESLHGRQSAYLQGKDVFVQDCYAGADPQFQVPIRVITESAWHNLFARSLFVRETDRAKLTKHRPQFTVICTPRFHAVPEQDHTNSEVFIIINFRRRLVLIGGTAYAGEIKKSIFSMMNYLLPMQGVLSMHCSANYGTNRDDVALFFGLSGTGKTTLSASGERTLIGDDEHGWSDDGVFNIEGGCYAKVIGISDETEPEIYEATHRFGTILENVGIDSASGQLDLDDDGLTENTRGAYPVGYIPRADTRGRGGHPKNILFLTYDAFGVLPPISKLSPEQAHYHFLSGYTAKVASTEKGVREPQATFSPCFGGPFLPLHPIKYADMLREKIAKHDVDCWLVNTGLTGGPYGVGRRFPLTATRAIVAAVLDGSLRRVPTGPDPVFGLEVPRAVPGVEPELLDPRSTWPDQSAYDQRAGELAARFEKNFHQYAEPALVG